MKFLIKILFVLLSLFQKSSPRTIAPEDLFSPREKYYVALFYLDSCLACRNSKRILEELSERNRFPLYYIDFSECRFYNATDSNIGATAFSEIEVRAVPHAMIIYEGRVTDERIGYEALDALQNPYRF